MRSFLLFLLFIAFSNANTALTEPPIIKPGIRHCLERLLVYYAYRVELQLKPEDRKIGVRCTIAHPTTFECLDPKDGREKYVACEGTYGKEPEPKSCTFREFLTHTSVKGIQNKGDPIDIFALEERRYDDVTVAPKDDAGKPKGSFSQADEDFDPRETAKHMANKKWGIGELYPFTMIKDGGKDWSAAINGVMAQAALGKSQLKQKRIDKWIVIKNLQVVADLVVHSRKADNQKELLAELRKDKSISVKVKDEPGFGEVFDRDATLDATYGADKANPDRVKGKANIDGIVKTDGAKPKVSSHQKTIEAWEVGKNIFETACAKNRPPPNPPAMEVRKESRGLKRKHGSFI